MQAMPRQDAPKAFWKDGVCHGGSWWHLWEWGLVVGDGALQEPVPSQVVGASTSSPPIAQHPDSDHSHCLTWKRNSREALTRFCYYHLKNNLACGKSSQCHMTSRFLMCSYQVPHDAICKYLFWIIFLCPTELFSALQNSCRSSLGTARSRTLRCPQWLCRHALPWPARKRRKYRSAAPRHIELFWLTDFHPQKCFPCSAVLLAHVGN